jgi:hypothetical protein
VERTARRVATDVGQSCYCRLIKNPSFIQFFRD